MNHTQHDIDASDEGAIVLGWLTKLAVAAAIVGVLGFDGISVGVGHLSTPDDADGAVQAASQNFRTTHNLQAAYNAAKTVIKPQESISPTTFSIDPDGTTHLTLSNTVHTLVLFRTSATAGWATVTATVSGRYTGS